MNKVLGPVLGHRSISGYSAISSHELDALRGPEYTFAFVVQIIQI